jgi:ATP-binding cassette subfamily F protein 3
MSVLQIFGLKKTLGAEEILAGIDLRLEAGEKVGCVGRNGGGKTTLLRVLEGELASDGGTIQLARGSRVGYVAQRPLFPEGTSARAYVTTGLEEVHRLEAELARATEAMMHASGAELDLLVKRHDELQHQMEALGGWATERRVEIVMAGIGLARELWDREASTFSGGEKNRTAMARELVSVPDLLLLDEPTNHLDLAGIEWLEAYLATLPSAVLFVSHDRRLLDNVADSIVELERGRLTRYPGNYAKYLELKAERHKAALRAWEEQQDFVRKEEAFIRAHLGSQRTGEAKGRQKRLESLERLERPYHDVRRPVIRMREVERGGELVLAARGLAVGYAGKAVVAGVDLRIGRGDRIGIVGPNGSGKSTLLRVLAGRATPLAGTIERGHRAACGFFDQETAELDEGGTPYSEIRRSQPLWTDEEVRSHLARFLFRGKDVELAVRALSGGERARLALAKLVLESPSWIALDEPTNHLDLAARTALEEFLGEFPGVLVFVSHDRAFLDALATRIVEVEDGRVRDFRGNYTEYRARLSADKARAASAPPPAKRAEPRPAGPAPASEARERKARNPWKLQKVEEAIMALEDEKKTLLDALGTETVYRDPTALRETQTRLAELERDLEQKNLEWESFG